jgi:hypothetical protein
MQLPHLIFRSITSFSSNSFELCGATNVHASVSSTSYRQYAEQKRPSKTTGDCLNGVTTSIGLKVPMYSRSRSWKPHYPAVFHFTSYFGQIIDGWKDNTPVQPSLNSSSKFSCA